ncbi:hypothetical protein ACIXR5_06720 [Bacteroides fragilis]
MKTITIKKQKYILKYTLRAFFIFENLTGRQFAFGRMLDEYLLFYSILLANNKDTFLMPFDEFIEACESDPALFLSFKEFFVKEIELLEQAADSTKKKDDSEEACSIRELYVRVVGEGGIAPDYFLDRMTLAEVRYFLEGLGRRNRESWEQTRIIAYVIAQANSTKQLKQSDVLRFPWDEADDEKKCTPVTDEEVKRLRAKAKLIEKEMNHV